MSGSAIAVPEIDEALVETLADVERTRGELDVAYLPSDKLASRERELEEQEEAEADPDASADAEAGAR